MNNKVKTCLRIKVASHLDIINNKVKARMISINNKAHPLKNKPFFHEGCRTPLVKRFTFKKQQTKNEKNNIKIKL